MTGGSYARTRRIAAGLSLRDVSNAVGVSCVFLGEFKRGVRQHLRRDRLETLARAIPGFSVNEYERYASNDRSLTASLQSHSLGLAVANRMDKSVIMQAKIEKIKNILRGADDDD